MPATNAAIGWGAEFWLGASDLEASLVQLAEITAITPPNPQTEDVEATHFGSEDKRRQQLVSATRLVAIEKLHTIKLMVKQTGRSKFASLCAAVKVADLPALIKEMNEQQQQEQQQQQP